MTTWKILGPFEPFIPNIDSEPYKAVMKWAVYAPALLHPLLYFTFSPEARHGVYILFSRMCSCCCTKSDRDVEVASDDEKGRMLDNKKETENNAVGEDQAGVPLQSKQEDEMWAISREAPSQEHHQPPPNENDIHVVAQKKSSPSLQSLSYWFWVIPPPILFTHPLPCSTQERSFEQTSLWLMTQDHVNEDESSFMCDVNPFSA